VEIHITYYCVSVVAIISASARGAMISDVCLPQQRRGGQKSTPGTGPGGSGNGAFECPSGASDAEI